MLLPVELLSQIIYCVAGDIHTLYSCTLACQAFHATATPLLYKRIHISPPKTGLAWQVLEDMPGRRPFATSRLPSHRGYVEEFILDGYITKTRPSRQIPMPIVQKIPSALCMWSNLRKVTITPCRVTGNVIRDIVKALKLCKTLKSLTVNEFVMEEGIMPELTQLAGLEEVILLGPTGALFTRICDWLSRMQGTMLTLNLLGNCGSLTPGILRRLTPYLSGVENLAIGLSYSLTHADIFACLSQLPKLKHLQLQYYQQARFPQDPQLRSLCSLTILHPPLLHKGEAGDLSALIRCIASSSTLKTLQVVAPNCGPSLCFDGLITHLAHRHRKSLTTLRMPSAHARGPALRLLLNNCESLQEVTLNITFNTLRSFPATSAGSRNLHTVAFSVCDHPCLLIDVNNARKIFDRVPRLRCITVNDVTWKGEWTLGTQGATSPEFVVSMVKYGEKTT